MYTTLFMWRSHLCEFLSVGFAGLLSTLCTFHFHWFHHLSIFSLCDLRCLRWWSQVPRPLQLLLCQCEQLSCHFYNGLVPLLSWLHSSLILIVIRNSIDQSAPGHEWKNPKKNHCHSKKLQYCYLTHYNKHNATIHLMSRLSQLLHDVDLL